MATFPYRWGIAAVVAAVVLWFAASASAELRKRDRHAGYYYPPPAAVEVYKARVRQLPGANQARRMGFVTGLNAALLARPFAPEYAIFAKGAKFEKLILVATNAGRLNTIYRVRALLATLTSVARLTPVFQEHEPAERLTFFDLAVMLGFRQITVSDGETFSHQIIFK